MGTLPPSPAQLSLILIPVLVDLPHLLREAKPHCNNIFLNMSRDYSGVFESRYAAFIIWSIFILAFIIVPIMYVPLKFLIGRICRRCICLASICGLQQDSDEVGSDGRPVYSVWDVEYVHLSHSKKSLISEIRASEIYKRLAPFSLELKADNMISRQSSEDVHDKDEYGGQEEYNASQDSCCIDEEDPKETQDEANHFTLQEKYEEEEVSNASNDDTEASTETSNSEEEANYTHLCLPLPGYNKNGLRKPKKKKSSSYTPDNNNRIGLVLFRRQKKDASKQTKELSGEDDDAEVTEQDITQQKDDRREVPIFCAVCLGEYETSERVCWSSNTECTHVFHHDCMLQWLKSLGKRACKQQRFSENPSVQQVMNYTMECPCCRQSFIDKSVDVDVGVGDDENV
mmetsp:Transcript_31768/g.54161  ORF Transcript_31768/g.54161 Transcript_31768/m.54161 type:complete len:400 (-) Transcript_31768:327-1526(-)